MHNIVLLGVAAFLAGFVDAVVGGGGLIQLPALLILFPHTAIATLFGTNKMASIAGTSAAVIQYTRQIVIPWTSVLPGAIAAGIFSFLGARAVQFLQPSLLRPVILVLLIGVGLYTYLKKDFGTAQPSKIAVKYRTIATMLVGGTLGVCPLDFLHERENRDRETPDYSLSSAGLSTSLQKIQDRGFL